MRSYCRTSEAAADYQKGQSGIEEDIRAANEYRSELLTKDPSEIQNLYEDELAKLHAVEQTKAEQEEQQRFFNRPEAKADFVHWSKATYWGLDEAIALIFGKDPESVTWRRVKQYTEISPFAKNFARVRDLALRAKASNQLFDPVGPGKFLAWAKRLEIDAPSKLVEEVQKRGVAIADWKSMYDELKGRFESLQKDHDALVPLVEKRKLDDAMQNPLSQSENWRKLEQLAQKAIDAYPSWKKTQQKVQKAGNLNDWLVEGLGANTREAELIKKILSDIFEKRL